MPPPPPPPPPAPPPPVVNNAKPPVSNNALLSSIQKGTKLRKTTTNDRSSPLGMFPFYSYMQYLLYILLSLVFSLMKWLNKMLYYLNR